MARFNPTPEDRYQIAAERLLEAENERACAFQALTEHLEVRMRSTFHTYGLRTCRACGSDREVVFTLGSGNQRVECVYYAPARAPGGYSVAVGPWVSEGPERPKNRRGFSAVGFREAAEDLLARDPGALPWLDGFLLTPSAR